MPNEIVKPVPVLEGDVLEGQVETMGDRVRVHDLVTFEVRTSRGRKIITARVIGIDYAEEGMHSVQLSTRFCR